MASDRKDTMMNYGLTVDEHDALQRGLKELPDTMPPRVVWQRIRAQAEAEGLLKRPVAMRAVTWYGAGLAAAALLAVVLAPGLLDTPSTKFPTQPTLEEPTNTSALNGLSALIVQSRQLESDLRALPGEPSVMRASMTATISDIEVRIAAIDYQLNDPELQMTPEEQGLFWRERVRLMKSLVRLRYAQAQRTAF